jgi:hypothetical protein
VNHLLGACLTERINNDEPDEYRDDVQDGIREQRHQGDCFPGRDVEKVDYG